MDTVCRRMTLLNQQVHRLMEDKSTLLCGSFKSLSGAGELVASVVPHLAGVSQNLYRLLMGGPLQALPVDGHHTVT